MTQKSFLETAILNGTGLWNGYARIDGRTMASPEMDYIIRLLGFNVTSSSREKVLKLFKKELLTNKVWSSTTLFKTPKSMSQIIVVDKNLEHNYGVMGSKSLKTVSQFTINYIEREVPSGMRDHKVKHLDFKFWILLQVKPSIKLEKRVFHSVSIELKYIDDHDERNIPEFEFQVRVPKCLIEEANRNPEFLKELKTKLGF